MRTRSVWRAASLLAVLSAFVADSAGAQDSNYWSSAYGTRSQLLGGVVTGSPGDISSVYYNPGALALTGSTELLLAGNAYQYQHISVDDGSGPGKTLASSSIGAVPSLFAGEVPILKHDRLAYAYLTRRSMDTVIEGRSTEDVESLAPIANPVFAAAEVLLRQNLSEGWYGFTWAHKLSPNLGLGVSPFLAVRSQRTTSALFFEGQDASGNAAVLRANRDFDYLHYGLLARIGLSGVRDSLTYGLTLTTPNLGVTGSGSTNYNTTLIDQTGTIGNVIGSDYEHELKAKYKTPLGVSVGASYGMNATRVHATVDWNAEVPRYTVIEGEPFVVHKPSGDSTVRVVIDQHLKAVTNWGIGVERRISPTFNGYLSYHSDLTGREAGDPIGASVTRWDLNHVAAGTTWHVMRSDFAFGVSAAFGSQPTASPPSTVEGQPEPKDLQTHETFVTVILGWKVAF